jgi:putative secretion ATPase (PEP-CTERM system associated)
MYERFYRLRERPFALTPDPDYLYPSRVHSEALNYLRYGIESHAGFIVITGAIGSGKTTLLQTLLRGLDNQTTVARVMNTLLDPRELVESAMIDLGLDPDGKSKPAMLKQLGEFLVNERVAGRIVLLVIDEAQNLTLPALEEIRMLSNLETEKSKLLQIVLIGQPDLRDKLDRPELEQLRQRITVSYHLEPLDSEETAHYVNHRLARASIGAPLIFGRGVTDRIHARSGGVPRLINVISDAALVFGYGEEKYEIDPPLIEEVIADLDATGVLGPRSNPERRDAVVPADPAAIVGCAPLRAQPAAPARPSAEEQERARAIAERERALAQREQEIVLRERELTEQRRVLTEQYRLLRSRPAEPAAAAPRAAAAATPAWPPVAGAATSAGATAPNAPTAPVAAARGTTAPPAARSQAAAYGQPPFRTIHVRRRPSVWRRIRQTLLGTTEPVLEDSL